MFTSLTYTLKHENPLLGVAIFPCSVILQVAVILRYKVEVVTQVCYMGQRPTSDNAVALQIKDLI